MSFVSLFILRAGPFLILSSFLALSIKYQNIENRSNKVKAFLSYPEPNQYLNTTLRNPTTIPTHYPIITKDNYPFSQ